MFGIIDWENELLQGLGRVEYQEPPPLPKSLVESDRWVCASAMQKAIRRNQLDMALKAAFSLKQLHPQQLWSRLSIISQEDIGAASPILVGQILWCSGKRVWREQNGGEDKVLSYLIRQMCLSPKSRVANDLLCLTNYHADCKKACEELADYTAKQLEEALLNPATPIVIKTIAAWYTSGTSKRGIFNLLERKGSPKALISLYEYMGVPEWLLDITRMSLGRGEGHGITMALAWMHQEMNEPVQFKDECVEPSLKIGEWYSEAYDIHTRSGGTAYKIFLQQNPKIQSFLNTHFKGKKHYAIIGHLVFSIEGHLMNNRVTYLSEQKLTAKALKSYVDDNHRGEINAELVALVRENFENIHECRKAILDT